MANMLTPSSFSQSCRKLILVGCKPSLLTGVKTSVRQQGHTVRTNVRTCDKNKRAQRSSAADTLNYIRCPAVRHTCLMNMTDRRVFISGLQRCFVIRFRMLVCDGACSWDECKEAFVFSYCAQLSHLRDCLWGGRPGCDHHYGQVVAKTQVQICCAGVFIPVNSLIIPVDTHT